MYSDTIRLEMAIKIIVIHYASLLPSKLIGLKLLQFEQGDKIRKYS